MAQSCKDSDLTVQSTAGGKIVIIPAEGCGFNAEDAIL